MILRYPVRERTPFAEIRRLGPFSTLRRRLGRTHVGHSRGRGPRSSPSSASRRAPTPGWRRCARRSSHCREPLLCPLSGGRDSRIVLCGVPAGRELTALTVDDDEGGRFEEEHAEPVVAGARR